MRAAATGHTFLSVTKQGLSAIVETSVSRPARELDREGLLTRYHIDQGNEFTHVILRGSSKGPNYAAEHVSSSVAKLAKAGVTTKLMVSPGFIPLPIRGADTARLPRSTARMATARNSTQSRWRLQRAS